MNATLAMPDRPDRPTGHAEASGYAAQDRRTPTDPARQSAIAERAGQMPKSCQATYLKVTRGKASPRMAIKVFCVACVGWDRKEVHRCTATACPLWMYRPFRGSGA